MIFIEDIRVTSHARPRFVLVAEMHRRHPVPIVMRRSAKSSSMILGIIFSLIDPPSPEIGSLRLGMSPLRPVIDPLRSSGMDTLMSVFGTFRPGMGPSQSRIGLLRPDIGPLRHNMGLS